MLHTSKAGRSQTVLAEFARRGATRARFYEFMMIRDVTSNPRICHATTAITKKSGSGLSVTNDMGVSVAYPRP